MSQNEYIRKADAIGAIWHSIDGELFGELESYAHAVIEDADNAIGSLEPADVVPVVRCGQCKYCTNNWHSSVYDECGRTGAYVSENDYCSKGEKDDTQRIL